MLGMDIRSRTLQVETCSAFPSQTDSRHVNNKGEGYKAWSVNPVPGKKAYQ